MTLSEAELERLSELTREGGAWLVLDDTYENFTFSGERHHCPQGPHVLHVFSFSKAGWSSFCFLGCQGARYTVGYHHAVEQLACLQAQRIASLPPQGMGLQMGFVWSPASRY